MEPLFTGKSCEREGKVKSAINICIFFLKGGSEKGKYTFDCLILDEGSRDS